jgi:excisionase family DNA binding protein
MEKLLYTVPEVMALTGLGRWKVYDLIRSGTLTTVKIGSCRRVPSTALHELVERLTGETAACA